MAISLQSEESEGTKILFKMMLVVMDVVKNNKIIWMLKTRAVKTSLSFLMWVLADTKQINLSSQRIISY